jgi:hypothetical protein
MKKPTPAEQDDDGDGQPEEQLDDRGRNEAFPLEQIAEAEHRWSSVAKSVRRQFGKR